MSNKRLAILLVACIVAACGRDVEPVRTELRITARPEAAASTRTMLRQDNSVAFADADKLAVFDGAAVKREFVTSAVYNDGSADFMGSISEPADSYIAVYPDHNGCYLYGNYVHIVIPETQAAVAGSFDPAANISVGTTASIAGDTHSLNLKNVCALLKFSVPEGQSYSTAILVTMNDNMAGGMLCTLDDEPALYPADEGPSDFVTLQGSITGGNWYYMAVKPDVLEGGFALYLFDEQVSSDELEKFSMIKSTSKTVTLQRSHILNLGIIGAEPGAAFEPLAGETILDW